MSANAAERHGQDPPGLGKALFPESSLLPQKRQFSAEYRTMLAFAGPAKHDARAFVAGDRKPNGVNLAVLWSALAMTRVADVAGANLVQPGTIALVSRSAAGPGIAVSQRKARAVLPQLGVATLIRNEVWTGQSLSPLNG